MKVPNIKFHGIPSSESRGDTWRKADRQKDGEADGRSWRS